MRNFFNVPVVVLAAAFLISGCSGGAAARSDAAVSSGAGSTCQDIRACVHTQCVTDIAQPCEATCIAKGGATAQAAYAKLAACTLKYCPDGNSYCGCEQQCFIDGNCLLEAEACVGQSLDTSCGTDFPLCH